MSRLTFLVGSKSYLLVSNFACFNQIFSNFVDVFSAWKWSPPHPKKTKNKKKKKRLEVLHKKQVICSSGRKAAKVFLKGLGVSKNGGLQLSSKEQCFVECLPASALINIALS